MLVSCGQDDLGPSPSIPPPPPDRTGPSQVTDCYAEMGQGVSLSALKG